MSVERQVTTRCDGPGCDVRRSHYGRWTVPGTPAWLVVSTSTRSPKVLHFHDWSCLGRYADEQGPEPVLVSA